MDQEEKQKREGAWMNAAFDNFASTSGYNQVEQALLCLLHTAFVSGWCSARAFDAGAAPPIKRDNRP